MNRQLSEKRNNERRFFPPVKRCMQIHLYSVKRQTVFLIMKHFRYAEVQNIRYMLQEMRNIKLQAVQWKNKCKQRDKKLLHQLQQVITCWQGYNRY